MDYKLERKIRLNSEPKHKSLYGWCLNEIDEEGKTIGRDLIPWGWSLYFTASSLRIFRETSIKIESEDESSFTSNSSQSTLIIGTLHSGYSTDGEELCDEVTFSFMGTSRKLEKFSLSISPSKEGDQDLCGVVAIPSYETEIDFRNHLEDDHLGFEVSLNRRLFDELVRAIETNSADAVTMRVSMVRGFYSEWSPSISTDFVKVLANNVDVQGIESGKLVPPTACVAKEFSLTFRRVNRLSLQNGFELKKNELEFVANKSDSGDDDDVDNVKTYESKGDEYFRSSVSFASKLIGSLRVPLWAIFVVLVLLLFK